MSDLTFGAKHISVLFCAKNAKEPCKNKGTEKCKDCKVQGRYINYEPK